MIYDVFWLCDNCVKQLCARVEEGACKKVVCESVACGRDACEGTSFAFKKKRENCFDNRSSMQIAAEMAQKAPRQQKEMQKKPC